MLLLNLVFVSLDFAEDFDSYGLTHTKAGDFDSYGIPESLLKISSHACLTILKFRI